MIFLLVNSMNKGIYILYFCEFCGNAELHLVNFWSLNFGEPLFMGVPKYLAKF